MGSMRRFFKPWRIEQFFDFFNTTDAARKIMLGTYLIDWLMGVFIISLLFSFYHTHPIFKASSIMAVIVSLVLMIVIKVEMT